MKLHLVLCILALGIGNINAATSVEGQLSIPLKKSVKEYTSDEQAVIKSVHEQVKSILHKAGSDILDLLQENNEFLKDVMMENEHVAIELKINQ